MWRTATTDLRTRVDRLRIGLRQLLSGPQLLAFMPAITLAAFWFGGETALVIIALLMPAVFAIAGLHGSQTTEIIKNLDPISELPLRSDVARRADTVLNDGPTQVRMTAALAIAIDEYAELEDRLGLAAALEIMRTSAARLRGAIREVDLMGRLDGPRFVIVLTSATRADLESLIQLSTRIQRQIQEPISIGGTRVYVTVTIGFCTPHRAPAEGGDALIEAAEQALADAQSHGSGAIRAFTMDMKRKARSLGTLAHDLPAALESDQIAPWFQPQVDTTSSVVTGFEVLARWEHPDNGLVPPAEFLPAAEQLGLLERLGEVMLYKSLNALRSWDSAGYGVPTLSINFSAEELRNPAIVEKVRWELDRFDITPNRLTVEVLETVIAQTANDTIIRNLRAFAELGFLVDLDDFGTGHASITNIKRFSVGRIKIDRSFVTQIDADPEQQNIVSAILTLAKRLELDTLAEGVETQAERAVLEELGCGHVQGYAVARPMPYESVAPWLEAHARTLGNSTHDLAIQALKT